MRYIKLIPFFLFVFLTLSCVTSQSSTTLAHNVNLSKYKYVIFNHENDGDAELEDIILIAENHISNVLEVVNSTKAMLLVSRGEHVLSPRINVKSEKWDGGHTYITITFHDYETSQIIAVIKSSGIGFTYSQDQENATKAIIKELYKAFNKTAPVNKWNRMDDPIYLEL